jgi:hypothetical protein
VEDLMPRTKGAIGKSRSLPADKLRGPVKKIRAMLAAAGVPAERTPSNDHIIGLLPRWIDYERAQAWVTRLVEKTSRGPTLIVRLKRKRRAKKA